MVTADSWRARAACAALVDVEALDDVEEVRAEFAEVDRMFFGLRERHAVAMCLDRCPVLEECRDDTLKAEAALGYTFPGVYGGLTAQERHDARIARRTGRLEAVVAM